jgi:rhodanese-related sulfurtransferase
VLTITPQELAERLAAGEALCLLDVREAEELAICRIDGAVHVPMGDVQSRVAELDPETPVVCICHHGIRSASVAGYLSSQDFEVVYNLTGGVDRWAVEVDPGMRRY